VEYTTWLIDNQQADGQWDHSVGTPNIIDNLGTAWGVIILSPALFDIPPDAVCSSDPSSLPTTGGLVNFSSAGTTHPDPSATIVSYAWDFGDGGSSTDANPDHTFGPHAPGVIPVTLTVTDNKGLTDTASCSPPVTVVSTNVLPNAEAGGPYSFCLGSTLILNGTASSDSDGSIVEHLWDWTVPQNFTPADANTASHDATAAFTALGVGVHSVALRVTDNEGGSDTEFTTVTVREAGDPACNQAPVCPAPESIIVGPAYGLVRGTRSSRESPTRTRGTP
jgi:PKD repeat protein